MSNMISFYNSEVERFNNAYPHTNRKIRTNAIKNFVNTDESKISWSRAIKQKLAGGKFFEFEAACLTQSLYRPFTRQWLYYNRTFNEMVYKMPCVFPMEQAVKNKVIQITGAGSQTGFSVLMNKNLPNLDALDKGQCFPRYFYEDTTVSKGKSKQQSHLFANATEENKTAGLQKRDAITDEGLAHFKEAYSNDNALIYNDNSLFCILNESPE